MCDVITAERGGAVAESFSAGETEELLQLWFKKLNAADGKIKAFPLQRNEVETFVARNRLDSEARVSLTFAYNDGNVSLATDWVAHHIQIFKLETCIGEELGE